jgi:hypothetical protein
LPNVSKVMPQWIEDLLNMCKADFARAPKDPRHDGFVNKMILRCDKSFLMEIPIWVFSEAFPTPSVYPLRGTVVALKQHYYNLQNNPMFTFPGHSMVIEAAFYEMPMKAEHVGTFERENCDALFLAWLMRYAEAKAEQNEDEIKLFKIAAEKVGARFNLRSSRAEHLMRSYQLKEDEEKVGERLGHSTLSKSRELYAIQASAHRRTK